MSVLVLYGMQRIQAHLPFNPDHLSNLPPTLSFNTAASFLTNTNWQNYAGEDTMSQFTQMAGLVVEMFTSAAAGIAVAVALIRGLTRARSNTLGNFWVDLVRIITRILFPISVIGAIIFIAQGAEQSLHAAHTITTLTGGTQSIPGGPIASQEAIKQLGTNGGGYLNVNAAHPYENPTGLTNLVSNWLLLCIPFALAWTFGKMAKDRRQGYAVLGAMAGLWLIGALVVMPFEAQGNIHISQAHVSQAITSTSPGGNMEGKEVRNGPIISALFGSSSTGDLDRVGRLRPRQLHAAGRRGPPLQHDAGGGEPRRRRVRALRHADPGPAGGVHRRADGGPDTGVPGQEGPGRGDEAGGALPADGAVRGADLHRHLGGDALVPGVHLQPGTARPHRGDLRLRLGLQQQRLRLRRAQRQHRLVQHHAGSLLC